MLHLPLWHSLIWAHRLCKRTASPFLNFLDPKWEIRFFYFTCNTRWWYGSLLSKAANSPSFWQEVRHKLYLGGGVLSYPVSLLLCSCLGGLGWWQLGTGLNNSLPLVPRPLLSSDLGFNLSSLEENSVGMPAPVVFKNSIFIPFTQTIHTIARDSQFNTLVKQLVVIVSTYWIALLCMELQEALSHQQ